MVTMYTTWFSLHASRSLFIDKFTSDNARSSQGHLSTCNDQEMNFLERKSKVSERI